MSYARVLQGLGTLVIGTTLCAGVQYRLFVRSDGDGRPEIAGVIEGRDNVLWEAFNAQAPRLRLQDGTEVGVRVVLYSPGLGSADVVTSEPVAAHLRTAGRGL